MTSDPTDARPERRLNLFLFVLFCAALAVHFHFATMNWHYQFMAGHEFRQTQTALISYYIDKENNFSLDYSVPLLGKPWVLPLEFPLYEWGVVWLSRATHLPQFEAARTISLACFYLTLPALYLLLGELGLSRPRRLLALACTLVCPVYIFYARAVLVDPMALLCSVWFLAAFVRTMQTHRWRWFVLCALCGTAAGLIKSLVWFAWVAPAAVYGAWRLVHELRGTDGWRGMARTAAWGLGVMILPVAASLAWTGYADTLKEVHPSAVLFTSHNLAHDNYGTFSLATRFSGEVWRTLFARWQESILPAWALGLLVLPGLFFLPSVRRPIAACAGCFLFIQALIPLAYAYQDYYFYTCAAFATVAIAFTFLGLLDSRLPRWLAVPLLLLPLAALIANYGQGYYPLQAVQSPGGSGLTETIKAYTPPNSVIIVAGNDWSAVIPYYAQRKALMIRYAFSTDQAYQKRAFADLADEEVSALVLVGDQRNNRDLVRLAAATFNLDDQPTYSHTDGDVYLSLFHRELTIRRLSENHGYHGIVAHAQPIAITFDGPLIPIPPGAARTAFDMVSPAPTHYRFSYGYDAWNEGDQRVLNAHVNSDLVVPAPAAATHIVWQFGIRPGAYEREGEKTNGVEFLIEGETPDGVRRTIFRRLLDPAAEPADRGTQKMNIPFQPTAGERLFFRTRPNGSGAFDWAYWNRIAVE